MKGKPKKENRAAKAGKALAEAVKNGNNNVEIIGPASLKSFREYKGNGTYACKCGFLTREGVSAINKHIAAEHGAELPPAHKAEAKVSKAAAEMGRKGGEKSSEAKTKAARKNATKFGYFAAVRDYLSNGKEHSFQAIGDYLSPNFDKPRDVLNKRIHASLALLHKQGKLNITKPENSPKLYLLTA